MRLAMVILLLAAVAVALVHLHRAEIAARHETERLRIEQVSLRRRLWDQQVRLGRVLSPEEVRRRVEEMALDVRADRAAPLADGQRPRPAAPARRGP